ncbi:hypothetical protein [Actinotalea sp. K2]|uniref:hypothetical protein n=1 Tax=Actinotalea sp. K2 TaxID=2939438 RepID=UPI00201801E9|nr:hypothetical protein [Actinotalea sp. K2]MCL3862791.1 hypothetical protein [Actinotalea sp. K2]
MDRTRRLATLTVAAALGLTLAACGSDSDLESTSSSFDLTRDDPLGFTACRDLELAQQSEDPDDRADLLDSAARAAAGSQTGAFRESVSPQPDPERLETAGASDIDYTVDEDALRTACEEVGFDFDLVDADTDE